MNKDQVYIGRIEWVVESERGFIGQLRPLYFYDEQEWRSLDHDDICNIFPNRGIVSLYDLPDDTVKGTMWQFCIDDQRYNPDEPSHDAFRATSPFLLEELLDLRRDDGEDGTRKLLTLEGIWLPFIPNGRIYLWAEENLWIGPLHLVPLAQTNRWVLDPAEQREPLSCVWPTATTSIIHLEEGRIFVMPRKAFKRLGMIDWAEDDVLLARVLRLLQQVDPAYAKELGLTAKAITRITERLPIGTPTNLDKKLETQRLQRVSSILERLNEGKEILTTFLTSNIVSSKIDDAVQKARQKTIEEIRREASQYVEDLSSQSQTIQKEADRLQQEVIDKQNELIEIENHIVEQQTQLNTQIDNFETTLNQRLSELMSYPEKVLSEVAIFRALLNFSSPSKKALTVSSEIEEKQIHFSHSNAIVSVQETSKSREIMVQDTGLLRKSLRDAFRIQGVPTKAAGILHCAFLTGAMPTLAGDNAFNALEAYASCISCNRILWLPISPTILEPSDILGKVNPTTRRFEPHSGGLLDLLLHAHTTNDLYLVVLDGINRAALDTYLMPILACYKDSWHYEHKRTLPLVHRSAVDDEDPYALVSHLVWPSNVLLAGILTQGVTAISPPQTFWSSAVLVHLDQFDDVNTLSKLPDGDTTNQTTNSTVSQETWQQWRRKLSDEDTLACTDFLSTILEEGFTLGSGVWRLSTQLYKTSRFWEDNDENAIENVITHSLFPMAISSNRINSLLKILNSTHQNTEHFGPIVQLIEQVLT